MSADLVIALATFTIIVFLILGFMALDAYHVRTRQLHSLFMLQNSKFSWQKEKDRKAGRAPTLARAAPWLNDELGKADYDELTQ